MNKNILIIGAGIGGLSTALALKKIGIHCTIYESAKEIKPVGAGIVLANNAMQVYDKLGIRNKIESAGRKISSIKICDASLNTILNTDLDPFEKKYRVYNVAIHRAELQKILAEEFGYENIHLNKRVSKIEKDKTYILDFDDGSRVETEILIAADGIHSIVRNQLFEHAKIRDTKQRCWRGVCEYDASDKYNEEAFEAWGDGTRFGFVKLHGNKVYWFAVINENLMDDAKSVSSYFKNYHADVVAIIEATKKEDIYFNSIIDLEPIHTWQNGTACLIGDAAHATTPNMGQGACQAIEDAYVISKLLEKNTDFTFVFSEYQKLRMKKAHLVVNNSWRIGAFIHHPNRLVQKFRNFVFKRIPKSINNKQLELVFNINQF